MQNISKCLDEFTLVTNHGEQTESRKGMKTLVTLLCEISCIF